MQRTSRASSSRTRGHLAGALVATVVGASVAIVFAGSPVGAAAATPKTITVIFTGSGASPSSVSINDGDKIVFTNHVPQLGSISALPLLGGLLGPLVGQVQAQGVVVSNAAQSAFELPTYGSTMSLTYAGPRTVDYSAQYNFKLIPLLGTPSTKTATSAGQVMVAAAPQAQQPAPNQPAPNPGNGQPGQGTGTGGGGGGTTPHGTQGTAGTGNAGTVTGNSQHGGTGGLSYQAPGPSVADQVVPHGTGGSASNARPQTPQLGTSPDQGAAGATDQGLPQLSGDGSSTQASLVDTASRNSGLGLPAIVAVVLLSVVTAALVRTLITQRRTVTA
jgi:hypothetical protein